MNQATRARLLICVGAIALATLTGCTSVSTHVHSTGSPLPSASPAPEASKKADVDARSGGDAADASVDWPLVNGKVTRSSDDGTSYSAVVKASGANPLADVVSMLKIAGYKIDLQSETADVGSVSATNFAYSVFASIAGAVVSYSFTKH